MSTPCMVTMVVFFATTAYTPPQGQLPQLDVKKESEPAAADKARSKEEPRLKHDAKARKRYATPEERDRMRIEEYVRNLTFTYELSDEQQKKVRKEVSKMEREYRESFGRDITEWDRLRQERYRLRNSSAEHMDESKMREIVDRLHDLNQMHPADTKSRLKRIEALLPAEQVAKVRARREQSVRQRDDEQNVVRGKRSPGKHNGDKSRTPKAGKTPTSERPIDHAGLGRAVSSAPTTKAGAPHPWDIYTEKFIRDHQLDRAQIVSAESLVKTIRERETALRKAQSADRAAADKTLDPMVRIRRAKELDDAVDALFSELKGRLNSLLTAEQRSPRSLDNDKPL